MSIQQNFPAISPSLSLNFARSKTLDPRITFTRTSSGTRTNERGLVEIVPANSPRFDHSYDPVSGSVRSLGLLVEEQRSNLITYSEDFDTWTKPGTPAGASISQDATISPDGSNTADKIVESNTTGGHSIWKGFTLPQTTTYTFSVFLKADERTWVDVRAYNSTNGNQFIAKIDLENGDFLSNTIGGPVRLDQYPDGWWRFSGECSFDNIYTQFFIAPIISNNNTSDTSYTGDGTSGIYVWGAQLEVGSFPTSYIPTTNSTVTRTADNVSMVGENFSSWYNQEQGSFLWIGNVYSREISPVQPFRVNQGATLRGLGIQFDTRSINNSTNFASRTQSSNIPSKIAPSGIIPSDNKIKIAGGYIESVGLSTIRAAFNGLPEDSYSGYTQTDITYDTMNELEIMGNRGITGTNYQFTGVCEQLVYYPRILSDDQLQNLTK
jgi:hypothetical protein